jgi:hypothetical protein
MVTSTVIEMVNTTIVCGSGEIVSTQAVLNGFNVAVDELLG